MTNRGTIEFLPMPIHVNLLEQKGIKSGSSGDFGSGTESTAVEDYELKTRWHSEETEPGQVAPGGVAVVGTWCWCRKQVTVMRAVAQQVLDV
ncbi:hypothetical protein L6452_18436 [Arctium lappa]|uniref:Uncharacterized protein n=1 Tax=Arctium lappa TaxID=4217 RepID=A0ACB9C6D9_ARCLA|nr:hypothetical protein L6452_18436 [Arctium lappa]